MANLSTGIKADSNLMNLKAMDVGAVKPELAELFVADEQIICAFKTIRDQVVFTNKRVFVVNVQGLTGKKTSYLSYPYSKVQYFGVETAGLLDIDSELTLHFSNGGALQLDFKDNVDIRRISQAIASFIL